MVAFESTAAAAHPPVTPHAEATVTYYGLPAVRPSVYHWRVATYIFVGGLSGGVQILATVADLLGLPAHNMISWGRVLALAGAILGGILLIADLHTPRRFLNMLRIFRATSPMSIGTYVLMSFGFFSLVALVTQVLEAPVLATISGVLASIAGLFMTTYTAALLAATSTPLWAAAPAWLAVRFASSAIASGAAALVLTQSAIARFDLCRTLGTLAMLALAIELLAGIVSERSYRTLGVEGPLRERPWGLVHTLGVQVLGTALPIALYALGSWQLDEGVLPAVASVLVLIGSLLMRAAILMAGNKSALRPADYFRFASLGHG